MSGYWFKPKRYGIGAAPASWEGWVVSAIYAVVVCGLTYWMEHDKAHRLVNYLFVFGACTALLLAIIWRRTKGGWRWRWGDDRGED